jgi:hypothetical protein
MCLHEKIRFHPSINPAGQKIYCWKNVKAKKAATFGLSDCPAGQTFTLQEQIRKQSA